MRPYILGIDPGLATCGVAVVELTAHGWDLVRLDVLRTEKSAKKLDVLAAADTLRRARELSSWLEFRSSPGGGRGGAVRLIAAERFSAPRNSSTAAKIGWAWGVIASLAERRNLPVVQPSPQETKARLCGRKDASKEDIERACRAKLAPDHPEANRFTTTWPRSVHEHAWDALAVVIASLDSDIVRAIRPVEVAP